MKHKDKKFVIASIIPTGIQCSIGGYIGDATLVTNKLAGVCDYLITNPNAVNGGAFNFKDKNVLYVEGYAIDQFFRKQIELLLPKKNAIGVILERISDTTAVHYALKSIEAFQTIAGVEVKKIELIKPLKKVIRLQNGQFCGEIKNINPLLNAAKKLLRSDRVNAIAISTHIQVANKYIRQHQQGLLPNPYGLLETLMSHAITNSFGVPSAHAPILTKKEIELFLFRSFNSDSRSALENISAAYLGSVLLGLDTAPRLIKPGQGEIGLRDVEALTVPSNCLRSIPVAWAMKYGIPVIQVRENKNIFKSSGYTRKNDHIINVNTYDDAIMEVLPLRKKVE